MVTLNLSGELWTEPDLGHGLDEALPQLTGLGARHLQANKKPVKTLKVKEKKNCSVVDIFPSP